LTRKKKGKKTMTATANYVTFEDMLSMENGSALIDPNGKIYVIHGNYFFVEADNVKIYYDSIVCPLEDFQLVPYVSKDENMNAVDGFRTDFEAAADLDEMFSAVMECINHRLGEAGFGVNFCDIYIDAEQMWIDFQELHAQGVTDFDEFMATLG
jgi:hypothetical protein